MASDGIFSSCLRGSGDNTDAPPPQQGPILQTNFLKLVSVDGFQRPVQRAVVCVINSLFKDVYLAGKVPYQRDGSLKDVDQIIDTFAKCGIRVHEENVLHNKHRTEILNKIKSVGLDQTQNGNGTNSNAAPDLFVLFLMSHGSENGAIYTDKLISGKEVDKKKIYKSDRDFEKYSIKTVFNAINDNPNLKDCYKIIVPQACRGYHPETLVDPNNGHVNPPKVSAFSCRVPLLSAPKNSVVLFPTVEGTPSYRSHKQGTYCVQPLCEILEKSEHGKDILELITRAQRVICKFPANPEEGFGQTPEIHYNARDQLLVHRFNSEEVVESDTIENDGIKPIFPKLEECGTFGDTYQWGSEFSRGYGAVINLDPDFDETKLKETILRNLELELTIFDSELKKKNGITQIVKTVQERSSTAAYLLLFVVGKLVPSEFSASGVHEVCLANSTKTVPLREIISTLIVGTNNSSLIGKPKFLFFIDVGKEDVSADGYRELINDDHVSTDGFSPNYKDINVAKINNHAFSLTYVSVGEHDLSNLIEHLGKPELRKEGCSLQHLLAKCVRLSNEKRPNGIQTFFTSTMPNLIHFPKFKETYVPPIILGELRAWNLGENTGWATFVANLLPSKKTRVKLAHRSYMLVAAAGQGKSRFTYELAKELTRNHNCQVLRVTLRKFIEYFDECVPKPQKLDSYLEYFQKECQQAPLTDNQRIFFIFDGFEKIAKLCGAQVKTLFEKIHSDQHPLLVTTRPHAAVELKSFLDTNCELIRLEYLSVENQEKLIEHHLSGVKEGKRILQSFTNQNISSDFLGNPQNLIAAIENENNAWPIFDLFDSLLDTLIKKALIKFEGKDNKSRMSTNLRQRRELMIVAATRLENLDFPDFQLTNPMVADINSVGIMFVENENIPVYHMDHFRDFLIALFLIHKHKSDCDLPNFAKSLEDLYHSNDFSFALQIIQSFKLVSGRTINDYGYDIAKFSVLQN